jgi:hypothetical protein
MKESNKLNNGKDIFLNWVKKLEDGNLSQFCKKIGIHVTTPVKWKKNNTGPSDTVIQKILNVYGISKEEYEAGPNQRILKKLNLSVDPVSKVWTNHNVQSKDETCPVYSFMQLKSNLQDSFIIGYDQFPSDFNGNGVFQIYIDKDNDFYKVGTKQWVQRIRNNELEEKDFILVFDESAEDKQAHIKIANKIKGSGEYLNKTEILLGKILDLQTFLNQQNKKFQKI